MVLHIFARSNASQSAQLYLFHPSMDESDIPDDALLHDELEIVDAWTADSNSDSGDSAEEGVDAVEM